jgi:diacylglycerol kinase family enzyme
VDGHCGKIFGMGVDPDVVKNTSAKASMRLRDFSKVLRHTAGHNEEK